MTQPLDVRKAKEATIVAAFHVLAQSSLAKAREDGLINTEYLEASTEDELQILGPSLTLFFAALSNTTNPPTVYVPQSPALPEFTLSVTTCPSNLLPLFRLWQKTVQPLQDLPLDLQADVARLLCDLEPNSQPVTTQMVKLSADIQSIAISISQRQTYLDRYTQDLQIGFGGTDNRYKAPPTYFPPPASPPPLSRQEAAQAQAIKEAKEELPVTEDPDLILVRETFYSVLSEEIERSAILGLLLREDPARGYYTAVALAIVGAALSNLTPDGQRVRVVSFNSGESRSFGTEDAPISFRVFVRALVSLGKILKELEGKDNDRAIEAAMRGEDDLHSLTLIELLKQELELGADAGDAGDASQTAEIRSVANHIRRMALAVTSLPGFKQRSAVFEILGSLSPRLE